jgi:hypothetical protein
MISYDNDKIEFYTNINNQINLYLKDKKKIEINIDNIQINDIIYIDFIPDSQKYIYELYPKLGIVNKFENDEYFILNNITNQIEPLLHDNVSYYGNTLGYGYLIYKIIN